jgi:hypothetical protein
MNGEAATLSLAVAQRDIETGDNLSGGHTDAFFSLTLKYYQVRFKP